MGGLKCAEHVASLSDTQSSFTKILFPVYAIVFSFVLVLSAQRGTKLLKSCSSAFASSALGGDSNHSSARVSSEDEQNCWQQGC